MKLSFSLPSKQTSRTYIRSSQNFSEDDSRKDNGKTTTHEYVTEFDPSKTPSDNFPRMIIPPKESEWWRPEKKMRNLELPLRSTADPELSFEIEAPSMVGDASDSGMLYGLNLRQTPAEDGGIVTSSVKSSSDGADDVTYGSKRSAPGVVGMLLPKLKHELRTLPEGDVFEERKDVPVEGFGAALLGGYGWSEGQGIGKNNKVNVKVIEINRRTAKEGLGFIADLPVREPKERNDTTAKGSHQPKWLYVGNIVRIVGGKNVGLKGKIIEILVADSDAPSVALKLLRNGEEVTVHFHYIAEMGSIEEEKCLKKLEQLDIQGQKSQRSRDERRASSGSHRHREKRDGDVGDKCKDKKRGRDEKRRVHEVKHDNGSASQSPSQNRNKVTPISWLTSNIRVRIIDKDFKGGRLYLKKGEVVDVVGPTTCDITMDGSKELIQGVNQDLLETALPRRGGQVIVLYGKHKGVLGNLVRKDLDEETGVVQDVDSHDLVQVRLEQIAEYVGDPSYLDY